MSKDLKLPRGVRVVPIPIYGGRLALCRTPKQFAKIYQGLSGVAMPAPTDCLGRFVHLASPEGSAVYLIGVFDEANPLATLVHESSHAVFALMRHVGLVLGPDNEEAFCYLNDWVFDNARSYFETNP